MIEAASAPPLVAGGVALGAITYVRAESEHRYDADTLRLAMDIARRAALAIANARAHEALKRERAWLRQVLDQMPAGVLIAEAPSGRIVLSNAAAERTAGAAIGEHAGSERTARLLFKDGRPLGAGSTPLARALRGEAVKDEELLLEDDGRQVVISVGALPVRDHDGRVVSPVATFQDITERKRAQLAAEQEGLLRERCVAILGHDLRNPLSAIMNGAQLLLGGSLSEAQRRTATRIASSAERISRMIADVLDLTRTRLGGGIPTARRPAALADVCRQVVDELRVAHPESDLRFEAAAQGWGDRDRDRVAQALSNLVANAVQHGREGTPVTVRLVERDGQVDVSTMRAGPSRAS